MNDPLEEEEEESASEEGRRMNARDEAEEQCFRVLGTLRRLVGSSGCSVHSMGIGLSDCPVSDHLVRSDCRTWMYP